MIQTSFPGSDAPAAPELPVLQYVDDAQYVPGVCNIGPAEIARRRWIGHLGAIATIVLLIGLLVIAAPPLLRFVIALPAAAAATGYLQAHYRFCAGFASLGEFNFGPTGQMQRVADPAARARDRVRALQIYGRAAAIGAVIGLLAVLVP